MKKSPHLTLLERAAVAGLLLSAASAPAATLGYWRFEGDGAGTAPTPGVTQVEDTNGRATTTTGVGQRVPDVSGNGNTLWAWEHSFAGSTYQSSVPAATVPQTGSANTLSINNAGSFPALFTWSKNSLPAADIETVKPGAWTIEASILSTNNSGNRTFVGRDGNNSQPDANASPLYFKALNGTLQINFSDEGGRNYVLSDTTGSLALNTWYNVAAVSDGTNLTLYKDSGSGYVSVGTMPLLAGDTRLAYDDNGSTTAGDTQWGWTIGRGRYGASDLQGDAHTDRWFGNIDEVRISDTALATSQFLFSVPEPSISILALLGTCGLLRRRR